MVTRTHKSKDRRQNGQKKKDESTKNDKKKKHCTDNLTKNSCTKTTFSLKQTLSYSTQPVFLMFRIGYTQRV